MASYTRSFVPVKSRIEKDEKSQHKQQGNNAFDGSCGFCDRTVTWVIANDAQDHFRFAPLESVLGSG